MSGKCLQDPFAVNNQVPVSGLNPDSQLITNPSDVASVVGGCAGALASRPRARYGETRVVCYGILEGRMVVVGYTPRGADRHVFSMRKANEREQDRIAPLLEV
jgi:uncharacterized DUF497 family protein